MAKRNDLLTIGDVAQRAGIATSALRFYEDKGLIQSVRNSGNHRCYHRSILRKVSIIKIAQALGFSLQEIAKELDALPQQRVPTARDWEKLSTHWRRELDARIEHLQQLRDQLTACIGCGCLSLRKCALYNPNDEAAERGPGPRNLLDARTLTNESL
ncbi:MAG: redox-sensitive transcriptional activator SoxR [Pseudomonadota bacterium]